MEGSQIMQKKELLYEGKAKKVYRTDDRDDAAAALEKAKGHYGQFENAAKYIDPRQE